jgi:hypothetical protein
MAGMGILAGGAEVFLGTKFRRGKNGKSNFAPAGARNRSKPVFFEKVLAEIPSLKRNRAGHQSRSEERHPDKLSAIDDSYLDIQQDILETFVDRGQL